jgi:hypothetical protein
MKKITPFTLLIRTRDAAHLLTDDAHQQALLMTLVSHAGMKLTCNPSYARLSEETRLSQRSLQRASAGLEAKGIVSVSRKHNHSNTWTIDVGIILKAAIEATKQRGRYVPEECLTEDVDLTEPAPDEQRGAKPHFEDDEDDDVFQTRNHI